MIIITNEIDVFATDAEGFVAFKNFSAEVACDIIDGNVEGLTFDAYLADANGETVEGPLTQAQEFEIENEIENAIMESWNNSLALGDF